MSLAQRITDLGIRIATEFKTVKSKISGNNTGDLTANPGLTTSNKTSLVHAINELDNDIAGIINSKGAANGIATLGGDGKVPASQLPGFVDDIISGTLTNSTTFTASGNTIVPDGVVAPSASIIYLDTATNKQYRWSGTSYVMTGSDLALGETSETAYRGDRGKIAYDHSQIADGTNPHGTTFANLANKPTTVVGFGLTDVWNKTEVGQVETDFVTTFETNL